MSSPTSPSGTVPAPRPGQAPPPLDRQAFGQRFRNRFVDPAFRLEDEAIGRLEEIAWQAYHQGRKAPVTHKAGPDYADPDYDLSDEWAEAKRRIEAAGQRQAEASGPSRVLVICGSSRNDGTCPGEMSKTYRITRWLGEEFQAKGIEVDRLDLSLVTSDYDRHIHPCKGCVSTAMPLCHWPCSCYPNHADGQTGDWMNEIYERWTAAHAVVIATPVYWYQSPSPLKLMIDRLVCADGGNPDPTTTQGKKAQLAKSIEADGWSFPKHLAGRAYGLVVHGDVAGIEGVRRALSDWLDWMGFIDAGEQARLDRFIGYYAPYFDSHDTLDADDAFQKEVRNVARAVMHTVSELRAGRLQPPRLERPRPK